MTIERLKWAAIISSAAQDAVLRKAPAEFTPLHWHGDVFDLPAGAVALASSALTPCQVYRYGANAYGFLCHLEVTSHHVTEWVAAFADELRRARLDGAAILTGAAQHLPLLHTLSTTVFTRWAELVSLPDGRGSR